MGRGNGVEYLLSQLPYYYQLLLCHSLVLPVYFAAQCSKLKISKHFYPQPGRTCHGYFTKIILNAGGNIFG
ncbi:hypothetical protein BH11BAC6_BH11BAC6_18440 [soil metagenome]